MTESEWLNCADPQGMLEFLRGKTSDRKLRLFAVACCRRVWASIQEEQFRNAVQAAELFADGMITKEKMTEVRNAAIPAFVQLHGGESEAAGATLSVAGIPAAKKSIVDQLLDSFDDPWWEDEFDKGDSHAPAIVTARRAARAAAHAKGQLPLSGSLGEMAEWREQADLLREIIGKPFRSINLNPSWLTPAVKTLGQKIYDDRAFVQMPALADELEKGGCDNQEILGHCRGLGPHVRGCWVVDLVLGRE